MMTTKPIGLYIHIPFCVSKCKYCDFSSVGGAYERCIDDYIRALLREVGEYKREAKIPVDTIYFGGGTPSLLSPDKLEIILAGLGSAFDLSHLAEFTLEANPGTLDRKRAVGYYNLGVNRISLGLQSIHENELKLLGRIHSYRDFLDCYNMLRGVGFSNVGVDLMYGIPEQTPESFRETLSTVAALSPEHISAYGLIIEEGTPFFDMRDSLPIPAEDEECEMYYLASRMLSDLGYSHYEISNYARLGFESRHNLKYWRAEEYIGLGASSYSYLDGMRYGNPRSLSDYLSGAPRVDLESVGGIALEEEYVMMRLRLSEGISLSEYRERFGSDFLSSRSDAIERYIKSGLVVHRGGRLSLTERGFYLSNSIICDLLPT